MMPIDYSEYPRNWKTEIRPRILERAGNKCERCGVDNYAIIMRNADNKVEYLELRDDGIYYTPGGLALKLSELPDGYWNSKDIRIVLTIAHINNHNPMACEDDNLQALCQRCHLVLDAPRHAVKAKKTRLRKKKQAYEILTGQMDMFDTKGSE